MGFVLSLGQPMVQIKAETALVVLSETIQRQIVTDGLTYEKKSKLTNLGWVDIHVLKMDLTNPNVDMAILRSNNLWSQREVLSTLLSDEGMVAGVNGSYFDMKNGLSDPVGVEYETGNYSYVKDNYNTSVLGAASLVVDESNQITMPFVSGKIQVSNEAGDSLYISAINGFSSFENPVILNKNAMADTSLLDDKAALHKLVIEEDQVAAVLKPEQTAIVPEDGYIILVEESQKQYLDQFPVGTGMILEVETNIEETVYDLILSGGGHILKDGVPVQEGLIIEPQNRHPRTALGLTGDGLTLISMVVDGRGDSIGATHDEIAEYLLEYDATDAIHMDGGGSSTIATRQLGTDTIQINNTPSDGRERKVVNGLGFISTAETGPLETLLVIPDAFRTFPNTPVKYQVVGYDAHYNPIELNREDLVFSTKNLAGFWQGDVFTPTDSGTGIITCYYDGISAMADLTAMGAYVDLDLSPEILYLEPGESGELKILGTDGYGYQGEIKLQGMSWTMSDESMGTLEGSTFTAGMDTGMTKLTMTTGNLTLDAYVVIGGHTQLMTDFESGTVTDLAFPKSAEGEAFITDTRAYDGKKSLQIDYRLPVSDVSQAVYGVLDEVYFTDESNKRLGLYVSGEGNGVMLKARLSDVTGKTALITLTDALGNGDWQYLETALPTDLAYPIKLERLYVVTLKAERELAGSIFIDRVMTTKAFDPSGLRFPADLPVQDPLQMKNPENASFSAGIFGATDKKKSLLDRLIMDKLTQGMAQKDIAVFAGASDGGISGLADALIWEDAYTTQSFNDVRFITLATGSGGLISTDYTQWDKLQDLLKNTAQNNIVLIADKSPVDPEGFLDSREGALLHSMLRDYKTMTGKNIYYINGSGNEFKINNYEGIRYIDLNGLNYHRQDSKVDLNNGLFGFNLYVVNGVLYYDYEYLYPLVEIW